MSQRILNDDLTETQRTQRFTSAYDFSRNVKQPDRTLLSTSDDGDFVIITCLNNDGSYCQVLLDDHMLIALRTSLSDALRRRSMR